MRPAISAPCASCSRRTRWGRTPTGPTTSWCRPRCCCRTSPTSTAGCSPAAEVSARRWYGLRHSLLRWSEGVGMENEDRCERRVRALLDEADVRLGGGRDWDLQVHDDRLH